MAACRLAAKGKTMADASYDAEVKSILAFLAMQKPAPAPAINPASLDIQPDDYVAPRFLRKLKNKVKKKFLLNFCIKNFPFNKKLKILKQKKSCAGCGGGSGVSAHRPVNL